MLVLVAGATGNIGQHLIDSLLVRGHQVRVLARNSSKLPAQKLEKLEAFVTSRNYYDIDALDLACTGVDAVICTYTGIPELQLDAQLLLLRAAERAGVTRFIPASWNYDWRDMSLGMQESYDPIISFRRHADLSSSIRPIYIFSGVLAEVLFSVPGHGDFSPKNHGVWDPESNTMEIFGTGEEPWHWTTEKDAAEFAAEIIQLDDAPQGGFWSLCSGVNTLPEIAAAYERVKGPKVDVQYKGTVSDLRERALERESRGRKRTIGVILAGSTSSTQLMGHGL
jgi:nucleoside-diphosphate-sugar epimerase